MLYHLGTFLLVHHLLALTQTLSDSISSSSYVVLEVAFYPIIRLKRIYLGALVYCIFAPINTLELAL